VECPRSVSPTEHARRETNTDAGLRIPQAQLAPRRRLGGLASNDTCRREVVSVEAPDWQTARDKALARFETDGAVVVVAT